MFPLVLSLSLRGVASERVSESVGVKGSCAGGAVPRLVSLAALVLYWFFVMLSSAILCLLVR
jgi:hypothetical protein